MEWQLEVGRPASGLRSSDSMSLPALAHVAFLQTDVNSLTGTEREEGSAGGGVAGKAAGWGGHVDEAQEEPNCLAVRGVLHLHSCLATTCWELTTTYWYSNKHGGGGWGVEVRWGRRQGNVF